MLLRFALALSLLVPVSIVFCQVTEDLYRFDKEIPAKYRIDARGDFAELRQEKYGNYNPKVRDRYAELTAYGKRQLMLSGGVYFDPPMAEPYLNTLASVIAPGGKPVKVYLSRNASFNAFAIHDGSLFINVGLLAEVQNEAALACIMGHEIAHYVNDDNRVQYYSKLKLYTKKHRNRNYELRIDKAHEDRVAEHIADSLGFILAHKAGYDIAQARHNFLSLLKPVPTEELSEEEKEKNALQALLSTHPDAMQRMAYLDSVLQDGSMGGGVLYKNGESLFLGIRKMARRESLQVLLEGHMYHECVQRAFRYHLFEPQEPIYLYYLAEALRRELYIMIDKGNDGFLIDGFEAHFEKGQGILHDLPLLLRDSLLVNDIVAAQYLDTAALPFETNQQALEYFLELGDEANITEVLLAKAIYYRKRPEIKDSALSKYEVLGGKPMAFLDAFKNNRLDRDLKKCKGELVLLDEIDFIEDHTYGYHVRYVLGEEKSPKLSGAVRGMMARKFPQKTVEDVVDLRHQNMNSYLSYSRIYDNMLLIEYMWEYEKLRALAREKYRGRSKREVKEPSQDKDSTALSVIAEQKAEPDPIFDPEDFKRRKRTKRDLKFYYIDPAYWDFLVGKGFHTVSYMKLRAYDDKTKIAGAVIDGLLIVYPGWWMGRVREGSNRFAFQVSVAKFDTRSQEVLRHEKEVKYKMTPSNLKSAVFDSMIRIE